MSNNQDTRITENETAIKLINQKLDFITAEIKEIKKLLEEGYIPKVEAEHQFKDHEKRLCRLEATFNRVLWIILAPILGALVAAGLYINQLLK
jgi:hypothetical protein